MHFQGFKLGAVLACVSLLWAASQPGKAVAEPDRELKELIARSVDRGVTFLRRTQGRDGTWTHQAGGGGQGSDNTVGATAMCGLALIEAGVDIDDHAVQRAAAFVRGKARELTYTYSISSAIMFLDRANKGGDNGTITMLAQKLLTGQLPSGGWSYYCPTRGGIADNSNTQFVILALWVARRSGAKVDRALQTAEVYFRQNQQIDGGWGYQFVMGQLGATNPPMTCAGLLAMALGFATKHKQEAEFQQKSKDEDGDAPAKRQSNRPDLRSDKQVLAAKDYITSFMSRTFHVTEHAIYTLWSLERVCMIYSYTQFNNIDWYVWGSKIILGLQRDDGGWSTDPISGRNCETAWALLFLRKSDLTGLDVGESIFEKGTFDTRRRGGVRPPPVQQKVDLGRPGVPGEARALKEEIRTTADPERVAQILDLLEKTKGYEYTTALAEAIPTMHPAVKDQGRLALQRRIGRMGLNTLKQYLGLSDDEIKIATLSILQKKDGAKDLIPDIVPLMRERNRDVVDTAYATLKKLSGKDLGRDAGAWQRWLDEGGK